MPFDGIFTCAIVNQLTNLIGAKIDKIHQPNKDDILINIKKEKNSFKLLLSSNPSSPRIQITNISRENPDVAPNFVMVLRKHILNSRIVQIKQLNFDRLVEIKLESKNELGYSSFYHLIIEIMGKHSNIILLNDKNVIVDAIKHLSSDMNRYRLVLAGLEYVSPPVKNKVNPLEISVEEFDNMLKENKDKKIINLFSENFLGLSKLFIKQVSLELEELSSGELDEKQQMILKNRFFYYISKIKSNDFKYILYYENNKPFDFYIFDIDAYKENKIEYLTNPSELLDKYYSNKDFSDAVKQKYSDLVKIVKNLLERTNKRIELAYNKIDECRDYEKYKIYADILMANQINILPNLKTVELQNFYDKNLSIIQIPLEENLNAVENAQRYYKKYTKEKGTLEIVTKQLEELINEKNYLEGILYNIEGATDFETLEEIKIELISSGYLKNKKKKTKEKESKSSPHHFVSTDGYDIYVGKNNFQNDYLTLKFAKEDDIWMHTKNIPGSHVIIKSKAGFVSDTALLEGALLAAHFSKAKGSTNVPVDYTNRKNVKKPSGAKPGMVIYLTNKTIYVTPDEDKINKIKVIG
ncbi:Rqc2 family fibronectin-binding protein, partial [Caloramator mitchellensis]|uniref:Rqc2 family fibronectin-binding protein n=1 Tax=Caloramator mitchellensis TaxID=908809 RepID=UPI000717026C